MTEPCTTEKAQAAASTAVDEGRHVTGVAKDEAQNVASEVSAQTRQLVDETRQQVAQQLDDQSRQQRDKLVGTLGTLSDDLSQMADRSEGSGLAAQAAREVADRARSLQSYLDGRDPSELLDDARDFARRRPGVFLLGALVAGVVAGRVVRGAKDAPQVGAGSTAPTSTTPLAPAAPPAPVAPAPPVPPVSPVSPVATPTSGYGETPGAVGSYPPPPASPTPVDRGSALDDDGPMGTNAAGYGRGDGLEGPA